MKYLIITTLFLVNCTWAIESVKYRTIYNYQNQQFQNGRTIVSKPELKIKSTENCKIVLDFIVNKAGDVTKVEVNKEKTTTSNKSLIKQVIAFAKKIKYNPSTVETKIQLPINIMAD